MNNIKDRKDQKDQKDLGLKKQLKNFGILSGIAIKMMITIVLGAFTGTKLDGYFPNQYSVFTIILSLLAIAIALYSVIKQVNKPPKKP